MLKGKANNYQYICSKYSCSSLHLHSFLKRGRFHIWENHVSEEMSRNDQTWNKWNQVWLLPGWNESLQPHLPYVDKIEDPWSVASSVKCTWLIQFSGERVFTFFHFILAGLDWVRLYWEQMTKLTETKMMFFSGSCSLFIETASS